MSEQEYREVDLSLSSDESQRRSFRNHRTIRRRCPKSFIFMFSIVVLLIWLNTTIKMPHIQQIQSQTLQQKEKKELKISPNRKNMQNFTKIYLNSYCEQSHHACKEHNIDALNTILTLMQSQAVSKNRNSKAQESNQQQLHQGNYINQYKNNASNIENNPFEGLLKEFQFKSMRTSVIEVALSIIKHSKVTTPKQTPFISNLLNIFKSSDHYLGIDALVSTEDSNFLWGIGKNMLISVQSKKQFSPHIFQIALNTQQQINVQIKGLTINIQQKVFITDLGTYSCRNHVNSFRCFTQQCSQKYQAIIFKFPSSQIQKIRIYQIIQW